MLRRPLVSYWATRHGERLRTPGAAILGPKVMIIDETAGSGGDLLPWMFRKYKLGPLVGKRTWGGLVGILGFPVLMDGGRVTAPDLAIFTEDGCVVENVGVPPDVEVEQWPAAVAGQGPAARQGDRGRDGGVEGEPAQEESIARRSPVALRPGRDVGPRLARRDEACRSPTLAQGFAAEDVEEASRRKPGLSRADDGPPAFRVSLPRFAKEGRPGPTWDARSSRRAERSNGFALVPSERRARSLGK